MQYRKMPSVNLMLHSTSIKNAKNVQNCGYNTASNHLHSEVITQFLIHIILFYHSVDSAVTGHSLVVRGTKGTAVRLCCPCLDNYVSLHSSRAHHCCAESLTLCIPLHENITQLYTACSGLPPMFYIL